MPATPGDRLMHDDVVQRRFAVSQRETYLDTTPSTLAFAHIALVLTAIVFWRHADTEALGLWAGIQSCLMIGGTLLSTGAAPERFLSWAIASKIVTSIGWACLPVVALAYAAEWQALQGAVLLAILYSSLGNATSNRFLHLAAALPIGIIPSIAFGLHGDGSARWLGVAFILSMFYTLLAGISLRQVQSDLFASSINNERLATNLTHEGERLRLANRELEVANSHLDGLAHRDHLTGLFNRAGFTARLNSAVLDHPGKVMVCYADLDRFKRINDAFGHSFGDQVLAAAANRIRGVLDQGEIIARQGGDELTIFRLGDKTEDLEDLGARVLSVFDNPFFIENRQIELNVSAGLVWLEERTTADDLMRFADTALYRAKELGRGQYAIFNEKMRANLRSTTQLQIDLGTAFDQYEIVPYLQPVVRLSTGEIASAEALARWESHGEVRTAADFIDTARDLGVLDRINTIVADAVLDFQCEASMHSQTLCPIAVNVSPLHLELMMARVIDDDRASSIVFELTEDGNYADINQSAVQLQRAREAGVRVLLDDFGVGFSSLSVATQIPIDGFKIDRGFVASLTGNPSAVAVVESIIQMAKSMRLQVIAEGVETPEQLALLRELGVDYAQGYLFSEAVPFETFAQWRRDNHRFDISDLSNTTAI